MNVVLRVVGTSSAVCLTLALVGCAPKFAPSLIQAESRKAFPSETTFDLVSNDRGGCRKANGPFVFLGSSNSPVKWTVRNKCGKDATVYIEKFKLKHKTFGSGPNPFSKPPAPQAVANGAQAEIPAVVQDTKVVGADVKGVNVYRYRIRIITADGNMHDDDPELILDWP
jgi:hypothetical protein